LIELQKNITSDDYSAIIHLMPPESKIGDNLKALRKSKKLTQVALAKKVGISSNYYSRIERDEENPSLEILKDIAKALKVKSCDILDF